MKPVYAFHPPLFAIYPALSLYAANVSLIPWQDTLLPMLYLLAGSGMVWILLSLLIRDWARAAAAVSVAMFTLFSYSAAATGKPYEELRISRSTWIAVVLLLAVAAAWKNRTNRGVAAFLNVAGSILVLLALVSIGGSHFAIRGELAKAEQPIAGAANQASSDRPDIFYIVLDGYGRTDTFESHYGFSDASFIKELKKKGFYLAHDAKSNYVQTEQSMASTLNMDYLENMVEPVGGAAEQRSLLDEKIDQSAVSKYLRKLGYRYFAITTGFPALKFRSADVVIAQDSGSPLFVNALRDRTPFPTPMAEYGSQFEGRRIFLEGGFKAMENLARPGSTPKFVVVHVLAPHPPFVFGPNGEPRRPKGPFGFWDGSHFHEVGGGRNDYVSGYREQAQYIAKRLLKSIDVLTAIEGKRPMILIQGDHGPKDRLDQNSMEKTDLPEVFGILSAYLVPDTVRPHLYESITPVNSFRTVLGRHFGADLKPLPDRQLHSSWEAPMAYSDVTGHLPARPTKSSLRPIGENEAGTTSPESK